MTTSKDHLVQPYLFFNGHCEEAIEFYRKSLGAEVTMMLRFKENPDPDACLSGAGNEDKIMHAELRIGNTAILLSDGRCGGTPRFDGFGLSLTAKDEADADRLFAALADGGEVQMPLDKTFFRRASEWWQIVSACSG